MSSREILIQTALREFMLKGFQKTSLNSIASQLNMTKPALYYYFPNKESLFLECIEEFFRQLDKRVFTFKIEDDTARERIKAILLRYSDRELFTGGDPQLDGFNHLFYFRCHEKCSPCTGSLQSGFKENDRADSLHSRRRHLSRRNPEGPGPGSLYFRTGHYTGRAGDHILYGFQYERK